MNDQPWLKRLKIITKDILKRENLPSEIGDEFMKYTRPQLQVFLNGHTPEEAHERLPDWCYERWTQWLQIQSKNLNSKLHRAIYADFRKKVLPRLTQRVIREGGRDVDAEDAFHNAYLKLLELIGEGKYVYRPEARISTFFFKIAENQWRRRRKELGLRPLTSEEDQDALNEQEDVSVQDDDPEERFEQVRRHLKRLAPGCRAIIRFFYYLRWSHKEIARKLDIGERASRNQLSRCMKKLRNCYAGDLYQRELNQLDRQQAASEADPKAGLADLLSILKVFLTRRFDLKDPTELSESDLVRRLQKFEVSQSASQRLWQVLSLLADGIGELEVDLQLYRHCRAEANWFVSNHS